jgi:hypothetical protein
VLLNPGSPESVLVLSRTPCSIVARPWRVRFKLSAAESGVVRVGLKPRRESWRAQSWLGFITPWRVRADVGSAQPGLARIWLESWSYREPRAQPWIGAIGAGSQAGLISDAFAEAQGRAARAMQLQARLFGGSADTADTGGTIS